MANVDKKQGVTFLFSDLKKLHEKEKKQKLSSPLILSSENGSAKIVRLKSKSAQSLGAKSIKAPLGARARKIELNQFSKANSVKDLKNNLERLSKAHKRLRYLLDELESITKK